MCMAAAQHRHGVVEWLADLVLSVRKMRLGDQERRDREAITRARLRRDDAVRGRARDFQGNDLDRSTGGAWSLGRR